MLPACSVMMSGMVYLHRRDPGEQACPYFVAVDLVQHLVSSAGVKIVRDTAEAGGAITVHPQARSLEVVAEGVLAAREKIDGQILSYLTEGHRIGETASRREKRHEGRGLERRETERIFDEGIDDRRVAAQPIEWCPRRLERGVQDIRACSRRPGEKRQRVERARAGENEAVDVGAVLEHVLLRGERAHAVPEQQERLVGVFLFGNATQPHHVVDQQIETACAEIPEIRGAARRTAVAAVIVAIDRQTS